MQTLERITHVPGVMGGRATVRGMRITVEMILSQLAAGQTRESLLDDFPYLESEDITHAIRYGALLAGKEEFLKTA